MESELQKYRKEKSMKEELEEMLVEAKNTLTVSKSILDDFDK